MSTQPPTPAAAAAADNNEQEKRQKDDDDDDDNNGARANHDHHPHDHHLGTLERRLKSRHVQFLALSGAIGTGLFVGTGQVLSLGGPLAAVLAYAITGANLYCVMVCLGEMAAWLPVPGAIPIFAARYVDPALGFTLAWNYWYQLAIGVAIEVSACVVVLEYWGDVLATVPQAALVTVLFWPMVLANSLPVRLYGEAEFVFGAIKLTTIVGLIVLMFVITVGGSPVGPIGFRYWVDPGPLNEYLEQGEAGRFLALLKVFIQATFAYGGSETVVVAAGETENPRRNIPKAMRRVFWRIAAFYVLAIFMVTLCVSSRDARLLNAITQSAPGAAQSPFVIAVEHAGIRVLPGLLNGVIFSSAWSAGNAFFYSSTRVLYAAALDGKAPRWLCCARWSRWGVPYPCVAATTALGCLGYLSVGSGAAQAFFWISNLSAASTLVVWAAVCVTYLRFYAGLQHHGVNRATSLPYRGPGQPWLAWFALCFSVLVAVTNGFDAFFPGRFSASRFVPPYVSLPVFGCLFVGYKLARGTRFVGVEDMDLWTGKAELDAMEGSWPEVRPRNWIERLWFWIA